MTYINNSYSGRDITKIFFDSAFDFYSLELLEGRRQLTDRERIDQTVAASKCIIFGAVTFGLVFDAVVRSVAESRPY